jgi:hypothetical protein
VCPALAGFLIAGRLAHGRSSVILPMQRHRNDAPALPIGRRRGVRWKSAADLQRKYEEGSVCPVKIVKHHTLGFPSDNLSLRRLLCSEALLPLPVSPSESHITSANA